VSSTPFARILVLEAGVAESERLLALASALPDGVPVFGQGLDEGSAELLGWNTVDAAGGAPEALASLARMHGDADTLVLSAQALLPPHALARLARAAGETDADVLSALDGRALTPLPDGTRADIASAPDWDAGCFLFGPPEPIPCREISPVCALWRVPAMRAMAGPSDASGLSCDVVASLFVADARQDLRGRTPPQADPRDPPPASPLAAACVGVRPVPASLACFPGLDPRPVVLHVLHGWGGGAERFVRELAQGDESCIHLALVARGSSARRHHGERLELALARDPACILRAWPLPRAIADTGMRNAGYRAVLDHVLGRFAVDLVVVSSLIGHDLCALETGRRTIVACHDYYPLWPVLHCDFGDPQRHYDRAELERDLPGADLSPFTSRNPAHWWRLRERYLAALTASSATLVAPSESVRANLLRIEPALAAREWRRIAHGCAPFPGGVSRRDPPPRRRLRVLVLGRIAGGKGYELLRQVIPRSLAHAEFFLVGAGTSAEPLFGQSGVHVELDYERDALPELAFRLAPDLALIAASVSETWSYTLGELRTLGLPVLATRVGSLAERIVHGQDGLLIAPRADLIVAALAALAQDRAPLRAIRARLAGHAERSLQDMVADWRELLPEHRQRDPRHAAMPLADRLAIAPAVLAEPALRAALAAGTARLAELQAESVRRGEWGHDLQQRLAERTTWAKALDAQVQVERAHNVQLSETHARLQAEFEERTQWALSLDRTREDLERERAQVFASWSWRMTRPLRYAARTLRSLRVRLEYRLARAGAFARRARLSIGHRGLAGSFRHAFARLGKAAPLSSAPPEIASLEADFVPFALVTSATPRVSVVIPVYNHFHHTHVCLRTLAGQTVGVPYEVIVVDDCSSDETAARLPAIGGVRVLRNAENLGFIGACNAGAALATGEYLVFLNNDTAPQPGWLDALCATFEQCPKVGLAGAKLVYPDGRLQEAGGIVFSDGSGWNYGRMGDPHDASYNYRREVDYCSGAAVMVPRALFERLGGFDLRYRPAYYEDTDFAFQVRGAGLRAVYEPRSVVVHFEGVSSGTDTASGVKRYQVVNQKTFVERWADALVRQPRPGTPIELAREHRARGRILVIDATTPQPDHDSGSLRLVNVMRALVARGWKVVFIPENGALLGRYGEDLQQLGVEVVHGQWLGDPVSWLAKHGGLFDAAWVSRHYVLSPLLSVLREYARRARLIFDTVDLHYLREQRAAALANDAALARAAADTRRRELTLVRASDVTLVVSPVERDLLAQECPQSRIEVLSNVHAVAGPGPGHGERRDLWFVGGFQHPPNVDAVLWFAEAVWPAIAQALPEVVFHVVGSHAPPAILALAGERVRVHGFVEDLRPMLDGCRLSVAPLRYGAGVKGKVNQAMAHGQPVVATSVAVEGMHLVPGEDVLLADSEQAFAEAVVRLYQDEALWQRLAAGGLRNVEQHFSFEAVDKALVRILPGY